MSQTDNVNCSLTNFDLSGPFVLYRSPTDICLHIWLNNSLFNTRIIQWITIHTHAYGNQLPKKAQDVLTIDEESLRGSRVEGEYALHTSASRNERRGNQRTMQCTWYSVKQSPKHLQRGLFSRASTMYSVPTSPTSVLRLRCPPPSDGGRAVSSPDLLPRSAKLLYDNEREPQGIPLRAMCESVSCYWIITRCPCVPVAE